MKQSDSDPYLVQVFFLKKKNKKQNIPSKTSQTIVRGKNVNFCSV